MKPFNVIYFVALETVVEPSEWKRAGVWKSPILPIAGLWVDVGDGNLREIDDVYVWPATNQTVEIHFVAEDDETSVSTAELMAAYGWEPA